MDNLNFRKTGVGGGGLPEHLYLGPRPSKIVEDEACSSLADIRIAQCSQSPDAPWKMKAMDATENLAADYSDLNVSLAAAKVTSENVRMKFPALPVADVFTESDNAQDIDKKLATKRVVLPVETKDETPPVVCPMLNVRKRHMAQQDISSALNPATLKITHSIIHAINEGQPTSEAICISYNRQHFSKIENLKVVLNTDVGKGSFGQVQMVKDSQTGKVLVKKEMKRNSKGKFEIEKNEIEVPLQFPNVKNIAQFFGLFYNGTRLLFIMEYAGISLRQLVLCPKTRKVLLEPNRIEKILLDAYTPISHLASHGITHCDIKPENICFNLETFVTKLVDFGSCRTSQNNVSYKGLTPEYMDAIANKALYELCKNHNQNYPKHKMGEKDDVFAMGLVSLYLIKGKHPLIYFFTELDTVANEEARFRIMKQISELTDKQMEKLLDEPMSDTMRTLLLGVLNLDRDKRWTASMAVGFLQEKLGVVQQPPYKVCKQEPQECNMQTEEPFVNRGERSQRYQPLEDVEDSLVPHQGLGVRVRHAASVQTGGILLPTKLKPPLQLENVMTSHHSGRQLHYLERTSQSSEPGGALNEQEKREYNDLVKSFSKKTQGDTAKGQPLHYFAGMKPLMFEFKKLVCSETSQRMEFQNPQIGQELSPGLPVQTGRLVAKPVFGISGGCLSQAAEEPGPSENIPNISMLMTSTGDPYRPKLKVRRGNSSQDDK